MYSSNIGNAYPLELQHTLRCRLHPASQTVRQTVHERIYPRRLISNMPNGTDLDESLMEAVKLRVFELVVVEAEEVVHDDVASKCWEGIGQIQRFFAGLKLLDADAKSVDVSVDYVDEIEDGATGEPGDVRA
jgi:hypothetical protein